MAAQTPIHGFDLPVVGADSDAWGAFLNANWSALDTLLDIGVGATFLPVAGGTMTGQITLLGGGTGNEAVTVDEADAAASAAAGAVQANLDTHEADLGNPHAVTAAQAAAVALAGDTMTGQLVLPGGGSGLEAVTAGEVSLKADLIDPVFDGLVSVTDLFIAGVVTLKVDVLASSAAISLLMTGKSKKTLILDADTTITVSGVIADQTVEVWITQGSTGGTASWSGVNKWIGGSPPVLSQSTGDIDIIILSSESNSFIVGQHVGAAS